MTIIFEGKPVETYHCNHWKNAWNILEPPRNSSKGRFELPDYGDRQRTTVQQCGQRLPVRLARPVWQETTDWAAKEEGNHRKPRLIRKKVFVNYLLLLFGGRLTTCRGSFGGFYQEGPKFASKTVHQPDQLHKSILRLSTSLLSFLRATKHTKTTTNDVYYDHWRGFSLEPPKAATTTNNVRCTFSHKPSPIPLRRPSPKGGVNASHLTPLSFGALQFRHELRSLLVGKLGSWNRIPWRKNQGKETFVFLW